MTLVEFLSPLSNSTQRPKVLATLYFYQRYHAKAAMTADEIKKAISTARLPGASKMNTPDVLARSGHFVDTPGVEEGKRLWHLTTTGEQEVRRLLGLPEAEIEVEHDVGVLTRLLPKIKDTNTREFTEESIKCLQAGLLRAAVVFLWSGAVLRLRARALSYPNLNTELQRHDPRTRSVSTMDHFAYVKDSVLLLALQDLGEVDKAQRETLEEALKLRNRCGHPTRYRPGPTKVSSFIEDIVGIVF